MNPQEPALITKIREAFSEHPTATGIWVSLSSKTYRQYDKDSGDTFIIRWICWNVMEGDKELTEAEPMPVHADLMHERVRADLQQFLPGVSAIVDDSISFEDD